MGRPPKSETHTIPTRQRLYTAALELFAQKGFNAVSVRDITGSLGLNEASLYNHYKNKQALLETIFERFRSSVTASGFKLAPSSYYEEMEDFNLADSLLEGTRRFLSRTDRETMLIWRVLMQSQYQFESAQKCLEGEVLNTPNAYFPQLLENLKQAGKVDMGIDCKAAGRILASMYFTYSFQTNLKEAWEADTDSLTMELEQEIRFFASQIGN